MLFQAELKKIGLFGLVLLFVCALNAQGAVPLGVQWRSGYAGASKALTDNATLNTDSNLADQSHVIVQFAETPSGRAKTELAASGYELLSYLGDNAFFARHISSQGALLSAGLTGLDFDYSFYPVLPEYKLDSRLISGDIPSYANFTIEKKYSSGGDVTKASVSTLALYVIFYKDIELDGQAAEIVAKYNGEVRGYMYSINGMIIWLPQDSLELLAQEDAVQWIEVPLPVLSETNDSCRALSQAALVQSAPYSLDGTGVHVMVYDGAGADNTHDDFDTRLTRRDGATIDDHPTHVAGTIGGSGLRSSGTYKGMAPKVIIESYEFDYDGTGSFLYTNPGDLEADYTQAINTYGVMVANNSIGTNVASNGFSCSWEGDYGATSMLIDAIIGGSLGGPICIVWANGNERGNGSCGTTYRTVAPPAGAKNHIAVGALNSNTDTMTSFSSWGPTDDGRIKPDISGPGCQSNGDYGITSCVPGDTYDSFCGTSMAAPVVTGLCALLIQDWQAMYPGEPLPRNSMIKSFLAHNAIDLGNKGPDYQNGYGSVRIKDTIDFVRGGSYTDVELAQGQEQFLYITVTSETTLKVTMAWDDLPATANAAKTLVNDVDLVAISPSGVMYYPWTLDPANPSVAAKQTIADHVNNIEQVFVSNPEAGEWKIRVTGYAIPSGTQIASVVSSPLLEVIPPDDLSVSPASDIDLVFEYGNKLSGLTKNYRIVNTGNASLDWSASATGDWYDLSASSGTLAANEFVDLVVSLNDNADQLAVGSYSGKITISNAGTGFNVERNVDLDIIAPAGTLGLESLIPAQVELFKGQTRDILAGLTLRNDGETYTKLNYQIGVTGIKSVATGSVILSELARSQQDIQTITESIISESDGYNSGTPSVGAYPLTAFTETGTASVKILAFNKYADMRDGGEYENTLNAIAEHFTDFSVTATSVETPEGLAPLLTGKDIFLIVEQEKWDAQEMALWAQSVSGVLNDFCRAGGMIIISDHNYGDDFINGTGLMTVGSVNNISVAERACSVMAPVHPVNIGVGNSFLLSNSNSSFVGNCDGTILSVLDEDSNPVVVNWQLGSGNVFLFGCDFFSYNNDISTMLANAVQMADSSTGWLRVATPLSGTLAGGAMVEKAVTFNTTGLELGTYNATIIVGSDNQTIGVPCSLLVKPDELQALPETLFKAAGQTGGPFDKEQNDYVLKNVGNKSLNWSARNSKPWLSLSQVSGTLAPGDEVVVTATIDSMSAILTVGTFTDTIIFEDVSNGKLLSRQVEVIVTVPTIFTEDFEKGTLGSVWKVTGTNMYRTQVSTSNTPKTGKYHLTMDSSVDGTYSRNELTLTLNMEDCKEVKLSFWVKGFSEESQAPATNPFSNGADFDGVAISADGVVWYEVIGMRSLASTYTNLTVDLDKAIATYGLKYNSSFKIRFNQYDNYAITTDGIAIDDIAITGIRRAVAIPVLNPEPADTNNYCNTINWTVSKDDPGSYLAQCASDNKFVNIIGDSGWITEKTAEFCNLMPGQTYWYRVKAGKQINNYWQQSSSSEFATDTMSDVNSTDSPDNIVLRNTVQLTGFKDDFEDGNINGWTVGSTSLNYSVTNAMAAGGSTYSLTINGPSSHMYGLTHTLDSLKPDKVTFYVRSSVNNSNTGYFVLGNGGTSNSAVFFYMQDSGTMGVSANNTFNAVPYIANQWYKITFVFNWSAKTIDYYVDDVLKLAAIPFRDTSVSTLTRVDLYNFGSGQAWWDQITIGTFADKPSYVSSGTIVTPVINLPVGQSWGRVDLDLTTTAETAINVDVINSATGEVLVAGVTNGADISSLTCNNLALSAKLSTNDSTVTPVLHQWGIMYGGFTSGQWSGVEFSTQILSADINVDGIVDIKDLSEYVGYWLADCQGDSGWCNGIDINQDGIVNLEDMAFLASHWLEGVPAEPDKLEANWQFNDKNDPGLDSGNYGRNGTLRNSPSWVGNGVTGGAISFDGVDDYIEIEGYPGIGGSNPRTIAAFIKAVADPDNADSSLHAITTWGAATTGLKNWFGLEESGKLAMAYYGARIFGGPSLEDGMWHHVAAVFPGVTGNANETKLYVDGIEVVTNAASLDFLVNTTLTENMLIGAADLDPADGIQSLSRFFAGLMDDVRVYNVALAGDEIASIVSESKEPLVHYDFNVVSSGVTPDSGRAGKDATLVNEASLTPDGVIGGALVLDGVDDYIEIGGYPGIGGSNPRTIAAFIKAVADPDNVDTSLHMILSWGKTEYDLNMKNMVFLGETGKLAFGINGASVVGGPSLEDGMWHHIAVVFSSVTGNVNAVKFYIDGIEVVTNADTLDRILNTALTENVLIGATDLDPVSGTNSPGYFFAGLMDDVRIYNVALTGDEIASIVSESKEPLVHYDFNVVSSGVTPDSGRAGKDATLVNEASLTPDGVIGGALVLDGVDDYVSVPHILNPADGPFSAFAWVKGGGAGQSIMCQTDGSGTTGRIWLGLDDDNQYRTVLHSLNIGNLGIVGQWDASKWHHVGIVWDGYRRHLYLDGLIVAEDGADIGILEFSDGELYIGAHKLLGQDVPGYSTEFWSGQIDEVRIYDRALTSTEIEQFVNSVNKVN